jgi:hypothetical protein
MPALVPVTRHKGRRADRLADPAVVDELAAGLDAAAEEGVRRAADAHAFGLRRRQQRPALFAGDGQRFFVVDGFPRLHRRHRHVVVRVGDGEVDDDLDVGIGEKFVHRAGARDTMLLRLRARLIHDEVRAGDRVQDFEDFVCLQIDAADVAAADDADFDFVHNSPRIYSILVVWWLGGWRGSQTT